MVLGKKSMPKTWSKISAELLVTQSSAIYFILAPLRIAQIGW
jgi:hypothetical protein